MTKATGVPVTSVLSPGTSLHRVSICIRVLYGGISMCEHIPTYTYIYVNMCVTLLEELCAQFLWLDKTDLTLQ